MDLSSLAYLACPVGMGLMMWMIMRGNSHPMKNASHEQGTAPAASAASVDSMEPVRVASPARSTMLRVAGMCFDWRVIAGLVAAGLAVWVLAPGLMAGALPLFLVAACPLSMLLMMRGMGRRQAPESTNAASAPPDLRLVQLRSELNAAHGKEADLTREIAELQREPAGQAASAHGHAKVR